MPPPGASRSSASPPSARASRRTIARPEPGARSPACDRARSGRTRAPAPPRSARGRRSTTCSSTQPSSDARRHRDRVGHGKRVRDQVVDHLPEPVGRAPHAAARARPLARPPPSPASRSASTASTSTASVAGRRGVGPRKREQRLDQPTEPLDLGERRPGGRRIHVLEPEAQRRQRRAQLVRGVGDERLLRVEQLLELRGRLVELVRQPAHLGRALPRARARRGARRRPRPPPPRRAAAAARRRARARVRPARRRRARSRRSQPASASSGERAGRRPRSDT